MKRWVRAVFAIALLLWPTALHAQAEKRIALLIGNKDYKAGVGALTNPLNDIRIVGEALKAVGFEVLKPVENATALGDADRHPRVRGQVESRRPGRHWVLYYSGHGIASAGENYLIPVDVEEPSTVELSVQGVKHSEVLAILRGEAPNAAHYLVLDACRNTLQGARGGKGFVPVGQQSGVLVAFATEPGKTASDIGQGSGPYAAALAAELVKPGQNDLLMFHNVRVAVMDKTNGDQVPWTEDGIQRRQRVLFGGESKSTLTPIPQPPAVSARLSEAAVVWDRTKDTTDDAVLEAFIARYKETFYADLARARLEELSKRRVAAATPDPSPTQSTKDPFDGSWLANAVTELRRDLQNEREMSSRRHQEVMAYFKRDIADAVKTLAEADERSAITAMLNNNYAPADGILEEKIEQVRRAKTMAVSLEGQLLRERARSHSREATTRRALNTIDKRERSMRALLMTRQNRFKCLSRIGQ